MQRHAAGARVGERAAREPAQRGARVEFGQDVGQQRGGHHARDAREREDVRERAVERGLGHAPQVRAQRLRLGARRPLRIGQRRGRPESQRQRQAAGPAPDRRGAGVVVQPEAREQRARFAVGERGEREFERHGLPAVLEPAGLGRVAAGHDHDGPPGERRQQRRAQEAAERAHPLVGVDQDQRALRAPGPRERVLDGVRHGREVARVDRERRPAGPLTAAADLAQQDALADPAGAVDEQDAGGRVGAEQGLGDQQLARAADEGGVFAAGDPAGQGARVRGHHLARGPRDPGDTDPRPKRH